MLLLTVVLLATVAFSLLASLTVTPFALAVRPLVLAVKPFVLAVTPLVLVVTVLRHEPLPAESALVTSLNA